MLGSAVDTANGTRGNKKNVKVGFVFCQFQNVNDSDQDVVTEYNKLIGHNATTGSNELSDFIRNESNDTVTLNLDFHASWVTLSGNYQDYKGKQATIVAELDQNHEFDNTWQIAIIAFPEKYAGDPGTYFVESSGNLLGNSYCTNGCHVDVNQSTTTLQTVNLIFLDPSVYRENRPHYTTIHEVLHALGLPDLYNATINRSYGWSVMSDCRQGWNLTGFEKLALGWDSVDNYLFLKSGTLNDQIISKQSADSGCKGVIVLPEDNGTKADFYFMEIPQSLGNTASAKTDYSDKGLLLMVAKPSSNQGSISPFVKARSSDASNTPFLGQNQLCSTNGISISNVSYDIASKQVRCSISVDNNYTNPSSATKLREHEQLVSGDWKFKLDITGNLTFEGVPCIFNNDLLDLSDRLKNKGYGFCAYVDNNGVFTLAAETEANKATPAIVKQFTEVVPTGLTVGEYFFKLDVNVNTPQISVYQGNIADSNPKLIYCLFTSRKFSSTVPGNVLQIFTWNDKAYALNNLGKIYWQKNDAREEIGNSTQSLRIENNTLFAMVGTTKYRFNGRPNDWTIV